MFVWQPVCVAGIYVSKQDYSGKKIDENHYRHTDTHSDDNSQRVNQDV